MELKFDLSAVQEAQENTGSSFGTLESGVYKNCTILRAVHGKTKAGNNIIDLTITTEDGHETTIYQAFEMDAKWASGQDNKYGYARFLRFAKATGMTTVETVQETLVDRNDKPVMKKGTNEPVVLTVFKDLKGKKVDLGIQKVLDVYNGEIQETNEIYDSFACGSENSDKLATRIKDKKTEAYKKHAVEKEESGSSEPETVDGL